MASGFLHQNGVEAFKKGVPLRSVLFLIAPQLGWLNEENRISIILGTATFLRMFIESKKILEDTPLGFHVNL